MIQFHFRCFTKAKSVEEIEWALCKCTPKFPQNELAFYAEQRFTRKGTFGGLDLKGTQELQKQIAKNLKKENEFERQSKQKQREAPRFHLVDPEQASALICEPPEPDPIEPNTDADFYVPEIKPKVRNTDSYENFVCYGKRNGVPSHVLAGLINALRIDDGVTDFSKFCSKTKINNQWAKINEKMSREHLGTDIICLKFDEKKGPAKLAHRKETIIAKVTCITEPGGKYLDHFEPEDCTAYTIAAGLFNIVLKYGSVDSLLVIGGDNCPTNSGTHFPHKNT